MAPLHLMITIDWFGKYDLMGAYEAAASDFDAALYLCIGKRKYQRNQSLQYIGIGTNVKSRLRDTHHKLKYVTRDREIWLGEISTAEPSGKKVKVTPATLDYAEWAYARFFDLPLRKVWFGGRQEKILGPAYVRPGEPPLKNLSSPPADELSEEDQHIDLL